ncbi:hypothetical protein Glove_493g36 [Diversispora epigaea]|uniref:BZIP domain-containing protein n=1 Tax=Diversispora epigaea TaxID=1348612 RepID=A0A397GIA5_9GLOM|nr:hypothetical protein Glove_493g36 [Diversispora epigaea]
MSFMSTISFEDFNEVSMYDMVNDTYDIGESSEMGSKRNQEEDRGEDKGEVGEEVGEWTRFLNNEDFDEVTMYDMVNDIYDIDKGESSEMGSRKRNREDGGEDKGEEVGEGSRKRIHLDGGEGDEEKEEDFDMNGEEGEGEEEKLSKKRMSDRISAAKYRKKKRDEVENLVQVKKELEEENKSLRDEIDGLWVELFELKEFMFVHDINCPLGPF